MRRSLAQFSRSKASNRIPFLADCITNMLVFRFSVHTGVRGYAFSRNLGSVSCRRRQNESIRCRHSDFLRSFHEYNKQGDPCSCKRRALIRVSGHSRVGIRSSSGLGRCSFSAGHGLNCSFDFQIRIGSLSSFDQRSSTCVASYGYARTTTALDEMPIRCSRGGR